MSSVVGRVLTFLRARWRWLRGHCPLCGRHLYATFPYYMTDNPNCPVCKDEVATDLRLWHSYRALGGAPGRPVAAATPAREGKRPDQEALDRDQARSDEDRWRDDGGQGWGEGPD